MVLLRYGRQGHVIPLPRRSERKVIRHNFGWTLVLLAFVIVVVFYFVDPTVMRLH